MCLITIREYIVPDGPYLIVTVSEYLCLSRQLSTQTEGDVNEKIMRVVERAIDFHHAMCCLLGLHSTPPIRVEYYNKHNDPCLIPNLTKDINQYCSNL